MRIYNFIKKNQADIIFLFFIILFSIIIRTFLIDKIPTNITGDESWDMSNVYKILLNRNVGPLTLLGDGSVPAIVFYPVAFLIRIFGFNYSIIFLRLNTIFYSLLSLVAFYFIVRKETSKIISFFFTILLSSNYVFLNFSRTAWINMISVFSSLFLIFFITRALEEKKIIVYLIAGFFSGINFYSYHYGRFLSIGIFIYLTLNLLKNRFRSDLTKGFILFTIMTFAIILPLLATIESNGITSLIQRPAATFAFSENKTLLASTEKIIQNQLSRTLRGFILLDDSVMNNGIENQRYLPINSPPVSMAVKILFIISLLYFIANKKYGIWWVVLLSILITQFFSDLPPNFSRGLFYIPFIYFLISIFASKMLKYILKFKRIKEYQSYIYIFLTIAIFTISFSDINLYFKWMNEAYEYNARQPGIAYEEFQIWQNYQINLIKNGNRPIVNQEWYQLRNSLLKSD